MTELFPVAYFFRQINCERDNGLSIGSSENSPRIKKNYRLAAIILLTTDLGNMRWLITRNFERLVAAELSNISSTAVVGGSYKEPELDIFARLPVQINYFGIEFEKNQSLENFYLDLNTKSNLSRSYDLVICSQVLEHVWNHQNTFDNLTNLVKNGGFLWIACPASNFAHGSPNYFSAGFTSGYISRNFQERNFEIIEEGMLGSRRNYIATHLFHIWLSERLQKSLVFTFFKTIN